MSRFGPLPPIPSRQLATWFRSRQIPFRTEPRLDLGFKQGRDQYRLFHYPAPSADETMGIFLDWHTGDFFDSPHSPHLAIGLRGPTDEDPHRGRGLAIGIFASHAPDPTDPDQLAPLFAGCPDPPGGPAFFIEDFTINEGTAPVSQWQLTRCREAVTLQNNGCYRVDLHVSAENVWAGIWQVDKTDGSYRPLGQTSCCEAGPCPEQPEDSGVGNVFIGAAFAHPETLSWIDHIHIAHWKPG